MKKRDIINLLLLIIIISYAAYRFYHRKYTHTKSRFMLDTIIEITVTSKNKELETVLDRAFDLIEKYDQKFSYFKEESELRKINQTDSGSIQIDQDFFEILMISEELFYQSDSLYDVTVGSLSELWDFSQKRIPALDSIEIAQKNLGFEKINYSKNFLTRPTGIKLNFGSLAKGFIIDRVVDFLEDNSVEAGFVNAGGDMRIFGYKKPLKIGIQHPRKNPNEVIEILEVNNKAIVTSGDYERFFEIDGRRYHHILNPKTGFPSENAISVTVISSTAIIADAYSTALFLMEQDKAIALVDQNEDMEVVIYFQKNGGIGSLKSKNFDKYLIE